jgi:hypothetical protein
MNDLHLLFRQIRGRVPGASLLGVIRTFPATIVLVTLIIGCGLATRGWSRQEYQPVLDHVGFDYRVLAQGRIWHLLTGAFFQSEPGIAWSMIAMVVSAFVLCELFAGSGGLLLTFFASDWIATVGTVLLLRVLAGFGMDQATMLLDRADAGSSAAAHGAYAVAAILILPSRLAVIAYGVLLAITIGLLFQQELTAAIAHLLAVIIGGLLGWFVLRPRLRQANSALSPT